jgi:Protein of unknown function (DUF2911)
MKRIFSILLLAIAISGQAQLKTPQPSTTQKITQDFGISSIELSYSRPSAKGRKVYGDVVPFGSMWRTGANSPTRIKLNHDITLGGQKLAIGEYSVFTIPGEKEWEIIINKDPLKKNVFEYNKEDDVLRCKVPSQKTAASTETFTIQFANVTPTTCDMQLIWENTIVSIPLTTSYNDEVMKQITDIMGKDDKPYNSAATYYMENGGDKTQALEWFKKGAANNPKAYWILFGQAKCELALNKKADAMATAAKALAAAKADEDASYVKNITAFMEKNK